MQRPPHPPPPGYTWQPSYSRRSVAHTAWLIASLVFGPVLAFVFGAFGSGLGGSVGLALGVMFGLAVIPVVWITRAVLAGREPDVTWQLVPAPPQQPWARY